MTYVFEHGDELKDQLSGFTGIVTGRSDYMTGCNQYLLAREVDDKGAYQEGRWFDEQRLVLVRRQAKVLMQPDRNESTDEARPGGPGAGEEAPIK